MLVMPRKSAAAVTACLLACSAALLADGGPPQTDRPPNIVLVAIDALRSDHVGCYGYQRPTTPNIDRLASEGVLFERCYAAASWTLPSFMSMFTGLLPAAHGCSDSAAQGTALSAAIPTFPERLKEAGYYCGAVVSNMYVAGKYGFARGFDVYDDYSVFLDVELGGLAADGKGRAARVQDVPTGHLVSKQANLLLEEARKSGKPFFLFFHYFDPHFDYVPPPPYNTKFDPDYKGLKDGRNVFLTRNNPLPERDLRHLIALYDGEIAYVDALVGELIRNIDKVCAPGRTLIILVSDHGEAFAEHGLLTHSDTVYGEETRVPMIWRWPGVLPKGHRAKAAVSNLDIAKTLKELAKLPKFDLLQGRSLWPALRGGQLPDDYAVFSQRVGKLSGNGRLAVTYGNLRLHALFGDDLSEQQTEFLLFDLAADPGEHKNIRQEQPASFAALKSMMERVWSECKALRSHYQQVAASPPLQLTEEEKRRLESMGYLGGRR